MSSLVPRIACLVCLLSVASGSAAVADAAKLPIVVLGPKVSVQAYGRQNPNCREWTNGCVLCTADEGTGTRCSTPGIACEPHGLTCKRMIKP